MIVGIREVRKTVSVYAVGDREFLSMKDARDYIEEANGRLDYTYYIVSYDFDYCEGRSYQGREIVATKKDKFGQTVGNAILTYCFNTHGKPVGDFYGKAQDNWRIYESEKFSDVEDLEQWIADKNRGKEVVYCNTWGEPYLTDSNNLSKETGE